MSAPAPKPKPEGNGRLINPRSAYDWSRISNQLDDMGLSATAFRVFCNLLRRSDKHSHTCYPGTRRIAHDCRLNRETVIEALRELEERGMLRIERGWGKRSDYEILPLSSWKLVPKTDQSEIGTGPKEEPGSGRKEEPVGNRDRNPIHSSLNPIQETTTTTPDASRRQTEPVIPEKTVVVDSSGAGGFEAEEKRRDDRLEALRNDFRLNPTQVNEIRRITKDKGISYVEGCIEYTRRNAKKNKPAYLLKLLREDAQITAEPERRAKKHLKPDPKPEGAPSELPADFSAELAWWQSASPAQRENILRDPRFDVFRPSMRKGVTAASLGLPVLRQVLAGLAQEAACAATVLERAQQPEAAAA
jgi:hypothetical protein